MLVCGRELGELRCVEHKLWILNPVAWPSIECWASTNRHIIDSTIFVSSPGGEIVPVRSDTEAQKKTSQGVNMGE